MRFGLISDLHFREAVAGEATNPRREGRRVGELLRRCLSELKEAGAELVVCAGDCVDDERLPGALEDLATVGKLLAEGGLPFIAVPGNHDPAPSAFFEVVPRPARWQRVGGCDFFVCFDDVQVPGSDQSRRSEEVMGEMRRRLSEPGPLTVVVQHYVVYPDHEGPGYNHTYQNAAEMRAMMEGSPRKVLSVSGHYHRGHALYEHN